MSLAAGGGLPQVLCNVGTGTAGLTILAAHRWHLLIRADERRRSNAMLFVCAREVRSMFSIRANDP